jgi:hypothetical protein
VSTELHWHAEREQLREALGVAHDVDLVTVAAGLRRNCDALEAENARLRALLSAARYLSSEVVRGSSTADAAVPGGGGGPEESFRGRESLKELLNCPACRAHLGADSTVVDACASVARETARPVGQVLSEYLWLHHRQQGHRPGD